MFSYSINIFDSSGVGGGRGPWDRKFKSQEVLDNFRKYADRKYLETPTHPMYNSRIIRNMRIDD